MLTIYKNTENGLQEYDEFVANSWVNLVDPTSDEIEQITEWGVPQDFITYPLDIDERPRTEREDNGTIFILIRIPYFQGMKADIPYTTIPLGIVLTDRFILTICRWPNDIMQEFSSGRVRNLSTGKRNRLVLRILLATANKYLSYLREINKSVEVLEDRLQRSMQNNEVLEILKHEKSLVYFSTALKSNELMLERLQRSQLFKLYPEDEDLLEDVITENQQAIEMVNITVNILSSLMDAFSSIISNNLNVVMKFLTSVTIILSIPTIVTSFFGMNVLLPFQTHPWAAGFVILLFLVIAGILVFIFNKRNWF